MNEPDQTQTTTDTQADQPTSEPEVEQAAPEPEVELSVPVEVTRKVYVPPAGL